MRLLLTRPEAESKALAARLASSGILSVAAPLLRIVPLADAVLDLADVRALLFTSVNGVAAFRERSPRRDLPVYAD
jgi:uroporphyrinogen-III synthase